MKTFDFLGFEPSNELKAESQNYLKRLLNFAFGVVAHDAYLKKTRQGIFEGTVKIHTAWNSFSASAAGASPGEVVEKIYKQLRSQITRWRRARTPALPLGPYELDDLMGYETSSTDEFNRRYFG